MSIRYEQNLGIRPEQNLGTRHVQNRVEGVKGYWCQKKFWPFYAWLLIWAVTVTIVEISCIVASSEKDIYQWNVAINKYCSRLPEVLVTVSGPNCLEQCQNTATCKSALRSYDLYDMPSSVCVLYSEDCLEIGGTFTASDHSNYYYQTVNTTRVIF